MVTGEPWCQPTFDRVSQGTSSLTSIIDEMNPTVASHSQWMAVHEVDHRRDVVRFQFVITVEDGDELGVG